MQKFDCDLAQLPASNGRCARNVTHVHRHGCDARCRSMSHEIHVMQWCLEGRVEVIRRHEEGEGMGEEAWG